METTRFSIESKKETFGFPAVGDFTLGTGHPMDSGQLLSNTLLSLYCLDDEGRRAIFVELPEAVDLTKAPFVYMTQLEHAQNVVAVPYETFMRLGDDLPQVQRPIMVYMSGRSGSTLLSHILNESGEVVSLSEPEAPAQFSYLWNGPGSGREQELLRLARSAARFLFRPYPSDDGKAHAIKLRSEGVVAMDLFQTALPEAQNLFSYRDALGWTTSFYRIMTKDGFPETMTVSEWLARIRSYNQLDWSPQTAYLDPAQEDLSLPEFLALWWIFCMETYLDQVQRGIPVLPIRFTDLMERREETLVQVFEYCGLPRSAIKSGMRAFKRDSQSGTFLERENAQEANKLLLSNEQIESVKAILRRHPILKTSDFKVPISG